MKEIINQIKKHRLAYYIRNKFKDMDIPVIHNNKVTISFSELAVFAIFSVEFMGNYKDTMEKSINPYLIENGFPTISDLKDIYEVIEERGQLNNYYSIEFDINNYKSKIKT
jgi:hypothetical protein